MMLKSALSSADNDTSTEFLAEVSPLYPRAGLAGGDARDALVHLTRTARWHARGYTPR
jgi:hypothetical protein